jgi:hypothetical protein
VPEHCLGRRLSPRLLKPNQETNVKDIDLATMSGDELWNLHEQLREVLAKTRR